MKTEPLRSLVTAYGLAALAALAAMAFGVSPLAALLAAWIGGAVAALVIAVAVSALRRSDPTTMTETDPAAEDARWGEDRDLDRLAAEARKRA